MSRRNDDLETVVAAARRVGADTGVSARALLAVALVESAGVAFAVFDGRREPLIRFEGHYFDRLLSEPKRVAARKAGLASPKAGAVKNPAAQAARWRLLDRAVALDPASAYAATSWGLGQVMGAHWKRLGYADPQALAAEARGSADGQLRIVAAFLRLGGLAHMLDEGAFEAFARAYNGPGFRANRYDAKIEVAAKRAAALLGAPAAAAPKRSLFGGFAGGAASGAGWSMLAAGLSRLLAWPSPRFSTSQPTRSSSISTERSPSSATIPQPSTSSRSGSPS